MPTVGAQQFRRRTSFEHIDAKGFLGDQLLEPLILPLKLLEPFSVFSIYPAVLISPVMPSLVNRPPNVAPPRGFHVTEQPLTLTKPADYLLGYMPSTCNHLNPSPRFWCIGRAPIGTCPDRQLTSSLLHARGTQVRQNGRVVGPHPGSHCRECQGPPREPRRLWAAIGRATLPGAALQHRRTDYTAHLMSVTPKSSWLWCGKLWAAIFGLVIYRRQMFEAPHVIDHCR